MHALGVITESPATWAAFLCSAAYTYEERFQSQVLLHHQRPGIKAVATLNQWDREKNRHIIRGSHGIPVFDAKHPECLTYVFDYQDTAGRSTPGLLPWTVYENKSGIARHNLLRRSGEKSLDSYVHTKVQQIVDTEVKSETSAAMRTELQKFLEQSAKYVVYTRLNMPVDNLDTSAFSFATQYQNRPKVLERLGTLLSHSLVACLSPVRDIAQAMHMTMPPPEGLAVQKKDTRTRSVPETSEVTAESSPEAPREWGFYVIPDLKTWATNSSERTPIEHYETFEEARDRFAALRDQPYNKTNDLNDDGQPYAHLTLGLESKDKLSSVDILQVRAGQNYLVEDFTRMQRLRADSVVLENLSRVAREIGFDRVRPYVMENGSYKALPDMPFSQWENPYFTVDSPEQGDTFTIYQLKGGSETRDYRFEPYESLQEAGLAIDRQNYDLVYTAPLDGKTTLEDIFRTFNLDRPPDFTGHSLSVSDIVVLNRGGDTKAYYCDSAGFVDVPSFLEQKMETAVDQPIINEDEIRRALCDGSGFENGKMRIQYYFSQPVLPPREEMVRWLKKEYGTGGRSWDFANGSRGWLDYSSSGFEIQCNTDNGQISHTLTWQEVSSRLQELVQSNRYLTDAEYPEYEEWLSARQAEQDKRAADLEQAKEIIREYCTENGFDPPEFEDLRHIDLAYSSTGEGDHSINVYVDLLHHKIVYNVDGERILSAQYASTAELVEHELSGVTFDELIGTAEQEYQERKREQAIRSAPQKRPCIPGDIVYLENDKALDEVALSYAEIKALCAGNPLIKEKMELDNEVARLSTLRSSHMSQIFELQDKIAIGYPASIQKVEESLDAVSKDIDVYRANSRFNPDGSEKFSAIVMGTTYTERKAADAALRDALQGATAGDVIIGQYRGFNIHAYYDAKAVSFMGYLQGEQKYNFEFNPKENFSSFRHLLEKLSDTQALDQERLTILNKNLEDAKEAVNQPFAYEKEFQTKLARLNELNTILNQEGGKTDVHPEIQELQAKIDQTYAAMAADPQKYLEYLNFRGQCVGMGVENSVAVFAQNPKATYCPSPEAIGSPKVKPGEEDRSISVLRTDGIERVYALEQYDLPESEYLDKAPLQWTEAQHSDLIHRVEDAAQLADISVLSDLRHGTGFFDASRNVIHIREGNNSTEQLKSLLEGYSEAVITRTSTSDKPVAELESAALTALLQVRCGVPIDDQLAERITAALEDAGNVGGFSMRDSVARLHNAMEYCVRYAELEQTSEQYQAQQIEPEELTPQSEAFMEMM